MVRIISFVTIIAGLCFGQFIESSINQKFPQPISPGWGMNQISERDNLMIGKLSFHRSPFTFNTMLIMEAEGESLQPKTPLWKQAGIYGLEFIGAGSGMLICYVGSKLIAERMHGSEFAPPFALCYNSISSIIIIPTCTWGVGKLFKQKGHWWKSVIGAGVGWGLFYYLFVNDVKMSDAWGLTVYLLTPSLGAVVGFNL